MAASDNVLRGGLTPKHIDVAELLGVLRFEPLPVPYLRPTTPTDGVEVFRPDVADFVLVRITAEASYRIDGPAIALCTAGSVTISDALTLTRGQAAYITPDEAQLRFAGVGELFLATTGE
jgi:mannose-6-phosphate isomerase